MDDPHGLKVVRAGVTMNRNCKHSPAGAADCPYCDFCVHGCTRYVTCPECSKDAAWRDAPLTDKEIEEGLAYLDRTRGGGGIAARHRPRQIPEPVYTKFVDMIFGLVIKNKK